MDGWMDIIWKNSNNNAMKNNKISLKTTFLNSIYEETVICTRNCTL